MGKSKVIDLTHPVQDFRTVREIQEDENLTLCCDSQDIESIADYYGKSYAKEIKEYGHFYIDARNGDYDRVYAGYGSIPYLDSSVVRLKTPSEILAEYLKAKKE